MGFRGCGTPTPATSPLPAMRRTQRGMTSPRLGMTLRVLRRRARRRGVQLAALFRWVV